MRALNATFELFDSAHLQAVAWSGRVEQDSKLPGRGKPRGSQKEYKNSGNKAKEYLKTKDMTFSMLHISRLLCADQPQSGPKRSERRRTLRKRTRDSRLALGCRDCDK